MQKPPYLQGFFVHFVDNRLYGDLGMVAVEPVVLFSTAKKKSEQLRPDLDFCAVVEM